MDYFLTEMSCRIEHGIEHSFKTEQPKITQLVKATDKASARKAVEKEAKAEYGEKITIYGIRVNDTIVGA